MNGDTVEQLHIPELIGNVDLTDYPGMGLDLSRTGEFEDGEYILLNIIRVGKPLIPLGYLRPFPRQSLLIEVERGHVVGFDFMSEQFYPEFLHSFSAGRSVLHASYVLVTDSGSSVLWFRRFPRFLVTYLPPSDIAPNLSPGNYLDYYQVYVEPIGGITDYIRSVNTYGCFPVSASWRICLDRVRVYPGGEVSTF